MEKKEIEVWTDELGGVFSADKKKLLHCPDVEDYVIPDHVEEISPHAFDTAPNLQRINFNNVLYIPERVVKGTYEIPDFHGAAWYGDYLSGCSYEYHGLFEKCPYIEQIEIGEKVKEIAPFALAGLGRVKSMNINSQVYLETLIGLDSLKVLTASFHRPDSWHPSISAFYISFMDANGDEKEISDGYSFRTPNLLPSLEECHIYGHYIVDNIRILASCKNLKRIFLLERARGEIEWDMKIFHLNELPQKNGNGTVIHYVWE